MTWWENEKRWEKFTGWKSDWEKSHRDPPEGERIEFFEGPKGRRKGFDMGIRSSSQHHGKKVQDPGFCGKLPGGQPEKAYSVSP